MPKQNKEQPIDKFIEVHSDIKAMIDKFQAFHDNHMNTSPDNISWGNVGDIQHYATQMEHILLSANLIKIEEAKYNDTY